MDRKEYLEYRASTIQSAAEQIGKYGRAILFLSSGAIALSVSSLASIAKGDVQHSIWALVCAWILFGFSLFLIVFSEYAGFRAANFNVHQIDKAYEDENYSWRENRWNQCVEACNLAAGLTFSGGAAALMWFAYRNIGS